MLSDFRAFGPGSVSSAFSSRVLTFLACLGDIQALRTELLNCALSAGAQQLSPTSEGLRLLLAHEAPDARKCVEPLDLTSFRRLTLRIPADVQVQHDEPSMVSFSSTRTRRRRRGADLAMSASSCADIGGNNPSQAGNESESQIFTFADFSVEIPT